MSFHERKQERKEYFERFIKGWKQRPCTACMGSGKETYKPNEIDNRDK